MVSLTVYGHARPSVRITARTKWTKQARGYLAWQRIVAEHCMSIPDRPVPWPGIKLTLTFYFATKARGDLSNCVKACEDGLQYGKLIQNDKAVREIAARLLYCREKADERVEVTLEEWSE